MAWRKITTAAEFHKKIIEFIDDSAKNGYAPTDHALYNFLGVRPSEYENLSKGKDKDGQPWKHNFSIDNDPEQRKLWEERDKREADDATKKLIAYREDRLVKELEKSRTTSSNVIFQLKQPKNGGYQDIQQSDSSATVTVKIDGIGGLEAFK